MKELHKDIIPNPKYDFISEKVSSFYEIKEPSAHEVRALKKLSKMSLVDVRLRFLKEVRISVNEFKRDGGEFVRTEVSGRMCSIRLSLGVLSKESKLRISDLENKKFGKTAFFKKYSITMMHSLCLIYGIRSFGNHSAGNVDEFLNFIIEENENIAGRVKERNEKDMRDSVWS